MSALVEAIFIAAAGGAAMRRVSEVEALAGQGLKEDRYGQQEGHWKGSDTCQVTLIHTEDLEEIERTTGLRVTDGEHRRNIVIRGVRLEDLAGKQFQVGAAVLEYQGPRPPCTYIQSLNRQPGLTKALSGRSGICARVVHSGRIRVGDPVAIL